MFDYSLSDRLSPRDDADHVRSSLSFGDSGPADTGVHNYPPAAMDLIQSGTLDSCLACTQDARSGGNAHRRQGLEPKPIVENTPSRRMKAWIRAAER